MAVDIGVIIWCAVKPIIKIYFILAVGFILSKRNILSVETTRNLSDILLTTLIPCILINKVIANISYTDIKYIGLIALSSFVITLTGVAFGFLVNLITPIPRRWRGGSIVASMFTNNGDLPIAYIQTLATTSIFSENQIDKGIAFAFIFVAITTLYCFNLGGYRLVEYDLKKDKLLEAQKKLDLEHNDNHAESNNNNSNSTDNTDNSNKENNLKNTYNNNDNETRLNINENSNTKNRINDIGTKNVTYNKDIDSIDSDSDSNSINPYFINQSSANNPKFQNNDLALAKTSSIASVYSSKTKLRAIELRKLPPQELDDVINEYSCESNANANFSNATDSKLGKLTKTFSVLSTEIGLPTNSASQITKDKYSLSRKYCNSLKPVLNSSTIEKKLTTKYSNNDIHTNNSDDNMEDNSTLNGLSANNSDKPQKSKKNVRQLIVKGLKFFLTNFLRPIALSLIVSITIALTPWLKALFVETTVDMPDAPDGQPPLNFIMDFTSYLGAAQVPFGLLLLGSTLARLNVKEFPPGFWKAASLLTLIKLCVMPIIGVLWVNRLKKSGWLNIEKDDDILAAFIILLNWGLPTFTTQVYLTAFFSPLPSEDFHHDHLQLDCLAICLLFQYPILTVSLPFVVTYALKVNLGF
ncbi:auxin efflux carrier [Ascoidea rubescens DSM 1968]|uniref:Auxin efflux carrier n=1 Tax=Ascoidea rubescens DSM 1968 TaxID=1344418 RepID=A0A1D2VJT8_9ASCO|nr:auxin efflux carrier [Ascoidea rubescens DSM 1968]ODV61863.1 auxin efflux carrier [Ascoidea rubescens DSM 1968]